MAATRTFKRHDVFGSTRAHVVDVTLDSSYPAGGYPLGANFFGMSFLYGLDLLSMNTAGITAGIRPVYDYETGKLVINQGAGGLQSYSPGGGDIKGSGNTNAENTDAASDVTNGEYVSTRAAFSTLVAGALLIALNPDVPRNVCITIENTTGGALNLFEGVSSFAVIGTFRGLAQTETITITSTAGNKSVGAAKFRAKYGLKPFDTITSITVTNEGAATLSVGAGLGSQLGLPQPFTATGSVISITKNGAFLSPSGLVTVATQTVLLGTLTDGDDVSIEYNTTAQAITGQSFTGVIVRVLALGG